MSKLVINGNQELHGKVTLSGDQQTILAIQAAAILSTSGTVIVDNVPATASITTMIKLLRSIKGAVLFDRRQHVLKMDITQHLQPVPLSGQSLLAAGSILARCRQVDLVDNGLDPANSQLIVELVQLLAMMGAHVEERRNGFHIQADYLKGTVISLVGKSLESVLALMMAATMAQGITVLNNPPYSPAIFELAKILNKMGARVHGAGTNTIRIQGVTFLHSTDYYALDDQDEAGAYLVMGALTGGDVFVEGASAIHLRLVMNHLEKMGNTLVVQRNGVRIIGTHVLLPQNVMPTLSQQCNRYLMVALLALQLHALGKSQVWHCPKECRAAIKSVTESVDASFKNGILTLNGGQFDLPDEIATPNALVGLAALTMGLADKQSVTLTPAEPAGESFDHLLDQLIELGADIQISFD
ncbi:hypothetical protein [Limosilactobacillus secaliphilus]|uniref:UDP-N-acetylglucosamine 1-carboxyvinyltransferase n=1 Tax=Limosilactobacillus secaliphilus TaxID=396268 RepID=A0A0R2I2L1_9LACO|nr:hypothetical protein [Limosilactobacillus secaliphilus]KRN59443.1 UDP-N-acetylglucosamine 1-carboxyvinyltransferase [Limosilactobacillus secaliphilus]